MHDSKPPRHWRIVAEEVTRQNDPQKMTELVEELLQALEQRPQQGMQMPQEAANSGKPGSPRNLGKTA